MRKTKTQKGITLVALIITIIVLLILAVVAIGAVQNDGIINYAKNARDSYKTAQDEESSTLSNYLDKINENRGDLPSNNEPSFNAKDWDEKAALEDVFIWQSDDPNNEGYGVVVGYKAAVDNYTTLRYPSRCTKITADDNYIVPTEDFTTEQIRSFTKNIKEIELPETVVEIGDYAFGKQSMGFGYYFTALKQINIPNSVTSIGSAAFQGCTGLTSVIIPNSVTSIGEDAFFECTGLISVTIPNSVTSITTYAFAGCTSLRSVTIPDSVTSIDWGAFAGCTGLTSVTIPNSVTSIGSIAFDDVPHIYYNGTATGAPWGANSIN